MTNRSKTTPINSFLKRLDSEFSFYLKTEAALLALKKEAKARIKEHDQKAPRLSSDRTKRWNQLQRIAKQPVDKAWRDSAAGIQGLAKKAKTLTDKIKTLNNRTIAIRYSILNGYGEKPGRMSLCQAQPTVLSAQRANFSETKESSLQEFYEATDAALYQLSLRYAELFKLAHTLHYKLTERQLVFEKVKRMSAKHIIRRRRKKNLRH